MEKLPCCCHCPARTFQCLARPHFSTGVSLRLAGGTGAAAFQSRRARAERRQLLGERPGRQSLQAWCQLCWPRGGECNGRGCCLQAGKRGWAGAWGLALGAPAGRPCRGWCQAGMGEGLEQGGLQKSWRGVRPGLARACCSSPQPACRCRGGWSRRCCPWDLGVSCRGLGRHGMAFARQGVGSQVVRGCPEGECRGAIPGVPTKPGGGCWAPGPGVGAGRRKQRPTGLEHPLPGQACAE